jgi:hypothetical protein
VVPCAVGVVAGAGTEDGVHFINEDDAWCDLTRQCKDRLDEFLGFANVHILDGRRSDEKHADIALLGNGAAEHGLASSRRTVEKNTRQCFGSENARSERFRIHERQRDDHADAVDNLRVNADVFKPSCQLCCGGQIRWLVQSERGIIDLLVSITPPMSLSS